MKRLVMRGVERYEEEVTRWWAGIRLTTGKTLHKDQGLGLVGGVGREVVLVVVEALGPWEQHVAVVVDDAMKNDGDEYEKW